MTTARTAPVRQAASLTLGVVDQIKTIALDAAREDSEGRWGVDGWVRLIHNLLDLQMRTYANVADIALAGPSSWQWDADTDPGPSLPVLLDKTLPYPCTISILKSFERVGRPDVVIKDTALEFEPAVLAADATSFRVRLTDQKYVGANYLAKVRLCRCDGLGQDSDELSFTVGL